jgi:hypothetical protein
MIDALPVMIRQGRVDCDIEIGPLDRIATEEMFASFYGRSFLALIRSYTHSPHFVPRTGAELQLIFMTHDAEQAVAALAGHRYEQSSVTEIRPATRTARSAGQGRGDND